MNRWLAAGVALVAVSCSAGAGQHAEVAGSTGTTEPLPPVQVEAVPWRPLATTTTTVAVRRRAARSASAPRPVARSGDCWGWAHLVYAYDWPHSTACAVLGCESGGNPNAKNQRSSATGLFQILNGPYDPAANVALAYRMWKARGWQPWNVGGCP